jgi:DNA-binding beta-propeller fold protein YncE
MRYVSAFTGLACLVALLAHAQAPADATGPYDWAGHWPQPVAGDRVLYQVSVFAETPDRVFIGNKGTTPPPGGSHGFDPGYPGATADHLLFTVDHDGKLLEDWSQWAGEFRSLHKIKINPYDAQKRVWVVDRDADQIFVFSHDGKQLLKSYGEKAVEGADGAHFGKPTDVTWLPDGTFFVTDGYVNSRVVKFDKDGHYVMQWGSRGEAPGQFHEPHAIGVNAKRELFVADRLNDRIQVFDTQGKFLRAWKAFGNPAALIVAQDQAVWVIDGKNGRLAKYTAEGKLLSFWGSEGDFPGAMADPHDMSVDPQGALYVSNGHGHRIDKYVPKPGADTAQLVGQPFGTARQRTSP